MSSPPTSRRAAGTRLADWALPSALIVLALGLWELLVRLSNTPRWFLPPPSAVGTALADNWQTLAHHTGVTAEETLVGFALSFVFGVAVAVAIAYSPIVERAVYPVVIASQAIPIIALAPILLIWFGYGLTPKIIVIVLFCFFPIAVNTVDGLRAADAELIDLLRSMGAGRWKTFQTVRLPASLPYVFSGTRIAAVFSVIGALVGEWVGSSAGLGYYMIRSASQFATDRVFAAILLSAVMGVLLFVAVAVAERVLLPWQQLSRERGGAGG